MKQLQIAAMLSLLFAAQAHAQDVRFADEYMKRLKMYETVQPLGETPFGESINLYTGELGFNQTDIEVAGQGPTIVLAREYRAQYQYWSPIGTLADWNLSIPRIETFVRTPGRSDYWYGLGTPGENWKVETAPSPNVGQPGVTRCTNFNIPYDFNGAQPLWWQGFELITERGGRQQILLRNPANTAKPQMTGANGQPIAFPAVTQDHWQIGCLPNTSNGQVGEAFLAVSPDGTKYYLDYLVGIRTTTFLEDSRYSPKGVIFHPRMLATMYVSRIEDRFGNYLTYQYTGDKLTTIEASDGRRVAITWSPAPYHVIQSITTQPGTPLARTWNYEYNGRLSGVELPDHSKWQFNLPVSGGLPSSSDTCNTRNISPATNLATAVTGSVVHPSGLTGTFTLAGTHHGRSYVISDCLLNAESQEYQEDIYPIFSTGSLISKTISGPGVPLQHWSYAYSPVQASATHDACAQNNTCPDTRWVDVTGPDGDRQRHTLSTRWGQLEGKALKTEIFQGTTTLRVETTEYNQSGSTYASPGSTLQDWHSNTAKSEVWLPVKRRTIAQQGKLFVWQADAFDAFARPTQITRSSTSDSAPPVVPPQSTPPPTPPPVSTQHPMPTTLTGFTEVDDSMTPIMTNYFIKWTAAPGPVRFEVREGPSTIIYSGVNTDVIWAARGNDRSFSVRACYSDGSCSAWLGPLSLYEGEI